MLALVMCIVALFLAFLELNIEGKNGWAAALPTWRISFRFIFRDKTPLTGYHVSLWLTTTSSFFAFSLIDTILFQKTYTGSHFFVVASQVGVVLGTEDALWFCLNYNSPVNHFGGALNQYFGYVLTLFFSGLGWGFAYLILGWSASGLFTTIGCQFGVCLLFSLLVLSLRGVYQFIDTRLHQLSGPAIPCSEVGGRPKRPSMPRLP